MKQPLTLLRLLYRAVEIGNVSVQLRRTATGLLRLLIKSYRLLGLTGAPRDVAELHEVAALLGLLHSPFDFGDCLVETLGLATAVSGLVVSVERRLIVGRPARLVTLLQQSITLLAPLILLILLLNLAFDSANRAIDIGRRASKLARLAV